MSRHVVFGTGQVGSLLVAELVLAGHDVVAVNRNGRGGIPGATVVGRDATDPSFTTAVCAGADAVHFCLNAGGYDTWAQEFPPLQRAVMAGARAAGARLVVLENLYAYGPTLGKDLVETLPASPSSVKAAVRSAMTDELLDAHAAGHLEVAIGRASDYFGPGATRSALGDTVFGAALAGRRAQVMGDPDQPHSYSHTPDVARALVTLASDPRAPGQVWHLPVAGAPTTREVVRTAYALAHERPRLFAAGATTLRLVGLVQPAMREYLHTLYQFTDPWVVDDSRYRTTFGEGATPLADALGATLAWYAARTAGDASRSTPSTRSTRSTRPTHEETNP